METNPININDELEAVPPTTAEEIAKLSTMTTQELLARGLYPGNIIASEGNKSVAIWAFPRKWFEYLPPGTLLLGIDRLWNIMPAEGTSDYQEAQKEIESLNGYMPFGILADIDESFDGKSLLRQAREMNEINAQGSSIAEILDQLGISPDLMN